MGGGGGGSRGICVYQRQIVVFLFVQSINTIQATDLKLNSLRNPIVENALHKKHNSVTYCLELLPFIIETGFCPEHHFRIFSYMKASDLKLHNE